MDHSSARSSKSLYTNTVRRYRTNGIILDNLVPDNSNDGQLYHTSHILNFKSSDKVKLIRLIPRGILYSPCVKFGWMARKSDHEPMDNRPHSTTTPLRRVV